MRTKAKKEFFILLGFFILPIFLGTSFYLIKPDYFSNKTINYGELLAPAIATEKEYISFKDDNTLEGLWTLIYIDNSCGVDCNKSIEDIKKIRLLTNDDMLRLQRVAIIADQTKPLKQDEDLIFAEIINEELKQKLNKYSSKAIFLADPIGNIMLYYNPQNLDISKVVSDLSRLLKYSRIG